MPLIVKICGLKTPEALDVALESGADLVGFVFFPPSPRHLGLAAARAAWRARQGPRRQGRAHRRCRRRDAARHRRGAQARHAAIARQRDAGAGDGGARALRPAGDEGAADRRAQGPRAHRSLRQGRRPADLRRARAAGRHAAGRARQAVRLDLAQGHRSGNSVHAVGRARRRQCGRSAAHHARARRRRVLGRRARARRKGPGQDPRLHPRRARGRGRARLRRSAHDRAAAQFVPHRPRRARAFRHLWRPLCRRDADAADPRSGEGLCGGQGRSEIPEGDGRPSGELCRAAVAALFRRTPDAALWRRQNLFQARGAQPHRRAQGEQRARPDHAGAAHGQDPHHRRDRRRHAWRRHRHAVRQVRPALHRLHGLGRRRAAEAERAEDEDARGRGSRRRVGF